jgi:hypothetical protein
MTDGVGRIVPPTIAPGQTEQIRRERQPKKDGDKRPKPPPDAAADEIDRPDEAIATEKDLAKGQRLNINV